MARKIIRVRRNSDSTISIQAGRKYRYIDVACKEKAEVFDAVKYELITMDISLDDESLTELLHYSLEG